jgi:hypothetical protein
MVAMSVDADVMAACGGGLLWMEGEVEGEVGDDVQAGEVRCRRCILAGNTTGRREGAMKGYGTQAQTAAGGTARDQQVVVGCLVCDGRRLQRGRYSGSRWASRSFWDGKLAERDATVSPWVRPWFSIGRLQAQGRGGIAAGPTPSRLIMVLACQPVACGFRIKV